MFDANFIANPYPAYQELLATGRIHWVEYLGGAWLVPHYDDVLTLLRDPRLSAERSGAYMQCFSDEERATLQPLQRCMDLWMVSMDGAPHMNIRRRLSKAFTPRTIDNLRPHIQTLTNTLIDRMIDQSGGTGQIELMHQFAHPLPAMVIAQLLGVANEDQAKFVQWSDELAVFICSANPTYEEACLGQNAILSMIAYLEDVVAERRQHPGDDLISQLVNVEDHDDMLTVEEIFSQCVLFLFAGHETTRNLIGNGLQTLLHHPDQVALLRRNPSLIKGALEEMVRYECPVQLIARIAIEDMEIHGAQIKRGQTVAVVLGSANRDPEQFSDPDRFDITRIGSRPVSFGHGAHVCIGMALAYVEAGVALTTLLERLPNLRLVNATPDWSPTFLFRSLRSLPLAFEPQDRALEVAA
ncbi:MAG TPA: cytochrome P450 [Herpetosiphonaceae bacterium]